jgi:predicted Na+-dependent transporter
MNWLAVLSPLSAWLVMLALSARAAGEARLPFRELLTLRHVFWAYALPTSFILLLQYFAFIDHLASLGLLICLLSGCGTSGAALARKTGTASSSVVALMVASAAIAIVTLPLVTLVLLGGHEASISAFVVLASLILAQWLPFQLGLAWFQRHPVSLSLAANLERMASLSVLVLIVLIAWRELPRLPDQPQIAAAAAGLAILLGLVSHQATAPHKGLNSMVVIRNLTAATLVASQLTVAETVMTALCAFGVVMYPVALLQVWRAGATRNASTPL